MRQNIIIPVETKAREFDPKLTLSLFLTKKNISIIIGSHQKINRKVHTFLPGYIYSAEIIKKEKVRIFNIIKNLGGMIVAWDEEGLVWSNAKYYQKRRLDAENFTLLERFFAWGDEQAEVVRQMFPHQSDKLRVTGNPRQDLYHPAFRSLYDAAVEKIRREHGSFILFSSNFGSVNHARLPYTGLEKSEKDIRALAAYSKHVPAYIEFRYRVFRSFCALVPLVARAFPDRTILIRPHPSENPAAWEEVSRPLPNVVVQYDHELIPWLLAAEVVIHNGCTTAVEAAMLERPVIEYRAVEDPEWENVQPTRVSIPAHTSKEVIALLGNPDALRRRRDGVEAALRRMIAHWNDGFASQRIVGELLALSRKPRMPSPLANRLAAGMKSRLRAVEKRIVGRLMPSKSANPAYIDKKFPPTPLEEVRARLHRLADLAGLPHPHVEELGDRIWRISPATDERGEPRS